MIPEELEEFSIAVSGEFLERILTFKTLLERKQKHGDYRQQYAYALKHS
jgi:hypothetical protein